MHKLSKRFGVLLAVSAVTLAALTACAPTPTITQWTDTPEPATEPLFASDEEALAAASETYARYLSISDAILAAGGESPEGLKDIATGQALEYELEGAKNLADRGIRATGATTFRVHQLQTVEHSAATGTEIRFYVCDDLSKADLLDASGNSVAVPGRHTIFPFEVAVVGASHESLMVSEKNLWTSGDFC